MIPNDLPPTLLTRLTAEAARRNTTPDALLSSWLDVPPDTVKDARDMYALTDANPDLIARFNRQFHYTYVNPASARMLAKPVEDILGYTFYHMDMPTELADFLTEQLRVPFDTGREHWTQYDLHGRKRVYSYEAQMIPVYGLDGTVDTVLTVSRDISGRKQAEAAMRESEQRYRMIVEGQVDLVCLYYPNTIIAYVNDAYCRYFNRTREEIVGRTFLDLTDPIERTRIFARLDEVLSNPAPKAEEYQLTDASGKTRWVSWVDHGIVDEAGKVAMVQAIGRDISHIKSIERELELGRERYQLLFDENPLPLGVYDTDTLEMLAANDAMERLYGYTRDELLNMTIMGFTSTTENPNLAEFLATRRTPAAKASVNLWRHRKKDGTWFDVEVAGRDIVFNGRNARLFLTTDLTERRALESERVYTQSLEIELQKEREITLLKERFTSMVTHEFRTPLSVIVSTVDILTNYMSRLTKENMVRKLEIVTGEAKRMASLLDDVLTLSRATAGKLRVTPEQLELVEVVRVLVDNLRLTDSEQHRFEVVAACDKAEVVSDRRLLEQILINLLTNAVKYSPAGTTITAEVCPGDDHVSIRVVDEGYGIPEEDQPRIFEAFHRADNAAGIEGTGLGLAIVKESVTVLGGEISFKSHVGQGTTFTLDLPLRAPADEQTALDGPQPY